MQTFAQGLSNLDPMRIQHDLPAFSDISRANGTFSQAVTIAETTAYQQLLNTTGSSFSLTALSTGELESDDEIEKDIVPRRPGPASSPRQPAAAAAAPRDSREIPKSLAKSSPAVRSTHSKEKFVIITFLCAVFVICCLHFLLRPPIGERSIVMTVSVCVCVRACVCVCVGICLSASISLELHVQSLRSFLCLLPMLWLSPPGSVVIRTLVVGHSLVYL